MTVPVPAVPLGIADLLNRRIGSVEDIALREVYFWCRSHKQAHKAGELCKFGILRNGEWIPGDHAETCIDIGPFMSEREACRLDTDPAAAAEQSTFPSSLGMEIER